MCPPKLRSSQAWFESYAGRSRHIGGSVSALGEHNARSAHRRLRTQAHSVADPEKPFCQASVSATCGVSSATQGVSNRLLGVGSARL